MLKKDDIIERSKAIKESPEPDIVENNTVFFKIADRDEVPDTVDLDELAETEKIEGTFEERDGAIYLIKRFDKRVVDEFNGVECYFSNEGSGWYYCTLDSKRKVKDGQVIDVLEDFWDSQSEPYRPVYIDFEKNELLKRYKNKGQEPEDS